MVKRPVHLREAHAHIYAHGQELSLPNLASCGSLEECLEVVSRECARLAPGEWCLVMAARPEGWRVARWPTMRELDSAAGDRPCVVMSFDHHALAVNSAAFAACGITNDTPDPPLGVIVREGGKPTGLLLETAARLVRDKFPEPERAAKLENLRRAVKDLAGHGFVEVHEMLGQPWLGPLLAELHDRGELPLKVEIYVPIAQFDNVYQGRQAWERPGLRLAGGKIFSDGSLNSRTAWVLSEYVDPLDGHPFGKPLMTAPEIAKAIENCATRGMGLAAHAIGDGAVKACLDAAESTKRHSSAGRHPLRIEHCELIDETDVPRFARLGVIASVQPCHLLYDIEVLTRGLPHRLNRVLPLREMIDSGLVPGKTLLFGSDVPIVRPHPEDSVRAAVERRRGEGSVGGGLSEAVALGQAIRPEEAWAGFQVR